jgi:small GTP-binding protein
MSSVEDKKYLNSQKFLNQNERTNSEANIKNGMHNNIKLNLNQNQDEEYDNKSNSDIEVNVITYKIKIVFTGDPSVGKTSIIRRFCENKFDEIGPMSTVMVGYNNKKLKIDPYTEVEMKIWDTAGQEKYRSMTRGYLRDSNGIFIVFDLSKKKSFDSLQSWLDEINNADISKNCVKILIGNKSDFKEKEVDENTAKKFAEENNMKFLSVSAKKGINIESMFEIMGDSCAKVLQEEGNLSKNNITKTTENDESKRVNISINNYKEDFKNVNTSQPCC